MGNSSQVVSRLIADSVDFAVVQVYILGDASGDVSNIPIFTASTSSGANAADEVWEIIGCTNSFHCRVNFDQTTPAVFCVTPSNSGYFEYNWNPTYPQHYPMPNPAGTGTTGNITLTTVGLTASGYDGFIVCTIKKKRTSWPL
jgi:hypothetical protein